jgi:poly(beta-D-mannuronate) lyase
MKPIHSAHEKLLKLSIDVLGTSNTEEAQCVLNVLHGWAKNNAHTKVDSAQPTPAAKLQSAFEMKWMLTSKALSYAYIKDYATPDQQKEIETWLIKIAERVISDTSPGATYYNTRQNNHQYWIGAALMSTGIATGHGRYIKKAKKMYEDGVDAILPSGLLPEEVKRNQMALHYHGYAASPLVLIAELSHKIGEDWYQYKDGKIKLLLKTVQHGMSDPAWFREQIGYEQRLHSNAAVNKQWVLFARNRFGNDFFEYPLTVNPAYHFDYCGDIDKLNKAGFFDKRIEITKKTGWLD